MFLSQIKIIIQIYHSNATTNINIRQQIQKSKVANSQLARQYNVSRQTISKWKKRTSLKHKSSKPNAIQYALTEEQTAVAILLRQSTLMSLDEV